MGINSNNYGTPETQRQSDLLAQFLKGHQDEMLSAQQGAQAQGLQSQKAGLDQMLQSKNLATAQGIVDSNAKVGRKVGVNLSGTGGVNLTQADSPINPRIEMQKEKQATDLSKRYEKQNGFTSLLQEIEAHTNTDGKGGILTNPDAHLKSTGKYLSAVPTGAIGLAESIPGVGSLLGIPQGSAEERKTLERLTLEYQKAIAGMKQSDDLRKQEKSALGFIASDDPALVEKGVRSLARTHRSMLGTIQAGYPKDVVNSVHQSMGDPSAIYSGLIEDNATPKQLEDSPQVLQQKQRLMELRAKYKAHP